MEDKFSTKLKNMFSSESSLKRIPFYLFLICILLIALVVMLVKINHNLELIAENGGSGIEAITKDENYENVLNVFTEDEKTLEDSLPYYKVDEETTSEKAEPTSNNFENTQKPTESTTENQPNDSVPRTTYVININSKKIHFSDCTFVNRTKEENKKTVKLSSDELNEYLNNGYVFCKTCGGN